MKAVFSCRMEIDIKEIHPAPADNPNRISIVMINSRENTHPEFTQRARNSALVQLPSDMGIDLIEINNHERQHSIGKCWNEGVKIAAPGAILFFGDDDYMSPEYCAFMRSFAIAAQRHFGNENIVQGVSSFMRVVNQELKVVPRAYMYSSPTGMYEREFLINNPFDESLKNNVDTEFMKRIQAAGHTVAVCEHYFGYYYTLHPAMVSGYQRFFEDKPKKKHVAKGYRQYR